VVPGVDVAGASLEPVSVDDEQPAASSARARARAAARGETVMAATVPLRGRIADANRPRAPIATDP
jgi:hypothetical protein